MNLIENAREALKAIRENLLRTSLTVAIIAIGIAALVGSITAIEALKATLDESFASLGAKNFEIRDVQTNVRRRGVSTLKFRRLTFDEVSQFRKAYTLSDRIGLFTTLTATAEAKRLSYITNPNLTVAGIDEFYLENKGLNLSSGRNFSLFELQKGSHVAIIGSEVAWKLFPSENPIGKTFNTLDTRLLVVGVLENSKGMDRGTTERSIFVPIACARQLAKGRELSYSITVTVPSIEQMDFCIGEAQGLMRKIRRDIGDAPDSFGIERSDSAEQQLGSIITQLRMGSVAVSFLTLLGASIGLMNIMLVSVTERIREIGVRKAIGATPARIREQFLMEAVVICLIGGVIGIFFGLTIGNFINAVFESKSLIIPWHSIVIGLIVCVIVGIVSGYLPARKASRLDPIESLRHE